MNIVEVNSICKTYRNGSTPVEALNDISFQVEQGSLFGLIGPDGAGKTSLIRIIATLLLADSGRVVVKGMDVVKDFTKIRSIIGYMPGKFSLYQDLTVDENLRFYATIFNTTTDEQSELVNGIYNQLAPFKKRYAGKLSGGMKQKLALCCALIHRPTLLLLDEPTTGVDAVSRKEFWTMLAELREKGMTIVVSTPYMDEAGLCDRIALMQSGNVMKVDTPANVVADFQKPLLAVRSLNMYGLLQDLRHVKGIESCYPFGEYLHVVFNSNTCNVEIIRATLQERGHRGLIVKISAPQIEDCFLDLMKVKVTPHESNRD